MSSLKKTRSSSALRLAIGLVDAVVIVISPLGSGDPSSAAMVSAGTVSAGQLADAGFTARRFAFLADRSPNRGLVTADLCQGKL